MSKNPIYFNIVAGPPWRGPLICFLSSLIVNSLLGKVIGGKRVRQTTSIQLKGCIQDFSGLLPNWVMNILRDLPETVSKIQICKLRFSVATEELSLELLMRDGHEGHRPRLSIIKLEDIFGITWEWDGVVGEKLKVLGVDRAPTADYIRYLIEQRLRYKYKIGV